MKEQHGMTTASSTEQLIRNIEPKLLHEWRMEAVGRLWHLKNSLLSDEGEITRCGAGTLLALAESHPAGDSTVSSEDLRAAEEAGKAWGSLSIAWVDAQSALSLFVTRLRTILAGSQVSPDISSYFDTLLNIVRMAAAERRVQDLEQQLAAHREESVLTQHLAGRFLANASHEIRTPLTAVLGFAELLLEETYGDLNEEQRTAVGHIENSAQNLSEIVNNLLDLLHIRSGKLTLQYRPVNIGTLLKDLYQILLPLAVRKNVVFTLEMPVDPGIIEADVNIVRHIIYHLLASGLRATPAHGEVSITTERDEENLVILTRDTALHLPADAIANMLDPFPRLENSPQRGYEGWEVGLPLVRRYVEIHGGDLTLTSLPTQGTLFRITLPITRTKREVTNSGHMIKTAD